MKKYVYKGTTPDVFIEGVGIVKVDEPFETEIEINNPDIEEVKGKEVKK